MSKWLIAISYFVPTAVILHLAVFQNWYFLVLNWQRTIDQVWLEGVASSFSIIGLKTCSDNCKYLILVGSILGFCFHSPRSQYLLSKSRSNVRVVWENVSSLWLRVFPLTASQIDGDIIGDRTFSRIILFSQSYKSHFYVGLFILTHCHRAGLLCILSACV